MDEKDFKKHLKDLAHGHHHPEEHDWDSRGGAGTAKAKAKTVKPKVKAVKPKAKKRAKRS
jgi:hypothetical protein